MIISMKTKTALNSNKKELKQHFIELISSIFLLAWAASFAKLIDLPSLHICFGRAVIAAITCLFFIIVLKQGLVIKNKTDVTQFASSGLFYALAFYGFYESVQQAGITIGIMSFYTFPLFTVLFEPFYFKQKLRYQDGLIGGCIFLGLILISLNLGFDTISIPGVLWGIVGAMGFSVRSILSKSLITSYTSFQIIGIQYIIMSLLYLPFIAMNPIIPSENDLILLIILGSLITAVGTLLYTRSLASFKAKTVNFVCGIEPMISLIIGFFFFREILRGTALLGIAIALAAVTSESILLFRNGRFHNDSSPNAPITN